MVVLTDYGNVLNKLQFGISDYGGCTQVFIAAAVFNCMFIKSISIHCSCYSIVFVKCLKR